jgi:hypothetical protein
MTMRRLVRTLAVSLALGLGEGSRGVAGSLFFDGPGEGSDFRSMASPPQTAVVVQGDVGQPVVALYATPGDRRAPRSSVLGEVDAVDSDDEDETRSTVTWTPDVGFTVVMREFTLDSVTAADGLSELPADDLAAQHRLVVDANGVVDDTGIEIASLEVLDLEEIRLGQEALRRPDPGPLEDVPRLGLLLALAVAGTALTALIARRRLRPKNTLPSRQTRVGRRRRRSPRPPGD